MAIFDMFSKRWYVPSNSKNVVAVPKMFNKYGIKYDRFQVIDEKTTNICGYIYRFNCIPVVYSAMKAACQGGNSFVPLEITLSK